MLKRLAAVAATSLVLASGTGVAQANPDHGIPCMPHTAPNICRVPGLPHRGGHHTKVCYIGDITPACTQWFPHEPPPQPIPSG